MDALDKEKKVAEKKERKIFSSNKECCDKISAMEKASGI